MDTRKLTEVPQKEFQKETNFIVEIDEELRRVPGAAIRQLVTEEAERAGAAEQVLGNQLLLETARASGAERVLADALKVEVARAENAEFDLVADLTTETERAVLAEDLLTENLAEEAARANAAEKALEREISSEAERAMTAEGELREDIAFGRSTWEDKYTRNEIDNKFSVFETAIDWKEAVDTYEDITAVYPNPEDGWTVNAKDTDYTYRWSGTGWVAISANAIPKATQSVDGLLSKEDKTNYDNANGRKHDHGNKALLDGITQAFIDTWNTVLNKMDKVPGKGLSANDYTNADKSKLDGITDGAEVNVPPDWNETDTTADAYIKNKPISMPASDVAAWAKADAKPFYGWTEITGKPSTFTPAAHIHPKSQITDMPTKLSQFQNDAGFLKQADIDTSQSHTHANKTVLDKITQALIDKWNSALTALPAHKHVKADVTDFPSSLPANGGNSATVNGCSVGADVPAGAKFTDTVYAHPNSGATAGTYRSVTVNVQGHVTGGTNPTTLSGYGITDAASSGHNHDGAYVKKTHRTLTLTASGWSGAYPYSQTLSVTGVVAGDDIKIIGLYVPASATQAQVAAWAKAAGCLMHNPGGVAAGQIVFKAYKRPAVDFQIVTEGG